MGEEGGLRWEGFVKQVRRPSMNKSDFITATVTLIKHDQTIDQIKQCVGICV